MSSNSSGNSHGKGMQVSDCFSILRKRKVSSLRHSHHKLHDYLILAKIPRGKRSMKCLFNYFAQSNIVKDLKIAFCNTDELVQPDSVMLIF